MNFLGFGINIILYQGMIIFSKIQLSDMEVSGKRTASQSDGPVVVKKSSDGKVIKVIPITIKNDLKKKVSLIRLNK